MAGLKISQGLTLPLDYVTKTAAIIAKRRVGKSYTGAVLAEEMCKAGIPWYALDPTEAWWGLRSSADGTRAGLPVIVLGGAHGDIPITEHDGKAIADLVVEEPSYYVIDLSQIDESHAATVRFVTAFLDRLYRRKAHIKDPLHGFWDEADMFAPQKPGPEQTKMLGAAESIVRRGGIRGLGTTLITQRAAVLNKNVLTQLDILLMLRTVSPQDQDAVDEYVKRNAQPEQRKEIMGSLASLPLGEAWLYGPGEEPELLSRVRIRERRTFNSSATPKVGEQRIEPTKLADVDLDALRARFAQQVEKAKAEDPAHLRREIQRLTRELADAQAATPEPERVEVAVLTGEHVDRLVAALGEFDAGKEAAVLDLMRPHATVAKAADEILELRRAHQAPAPTTARPGRIRAAAPPAPPGGSAAPPPVPAAQTHEHQLPDRPELNGDEPQLKAGARRILDELATVHPLRLTRSQVALATGMKATTRRASRPTACWWLRSGAARPSS